MSRTIRSGIRTRPGEMVENFGKNWRISMKRKNLGLNYKYKLSLSASWALKEGDHDAMGN
jgi:hypothetical protein